VPSRWRTAPAHSCGFHRPPALFTIRGITGCADRGYQKTGFFEVDTGEELDWTIELSGAKTSESTNQ